MSDALWSRSKRFFLAGTVFALLALKFRATLAAGIDLPASGTDWLFPSGWNAWLTARNGQWDPFLLRLFNSIFESLVAGISISLIARCCRPSNGGGWAVLLNGSIQLVIASFGPPPLVESWRQPWFIALLCGALLTISFIRRLRIAVLTTFILVTSAVWWTGALRPAAPEYPAPGDPRGAAIRDFLRSGNPAGLPARPSGESEHMIAALAQPAVRLQLPLSAREALPTGQPIKSSFAYVALSARRTGDDLSAPASVVLKQANGELIPALQGELPADREWHRLNLPVPSGKFTILVQGAVETGPAIEYSAGSRDAGKLLRAWPMLIILAVICALGGTLCLVIPNERRGWKLAWNPRERRILPWLALLAYAGVLVPFLDTYAGGSDSAGYLGSARLLQHFQLTAVTPVPSDLASTKLPPTGFLPRGFALSAQSPAGGARPPGALGLTAFWPERGLEPARHPTSVPPMVPTYPVGLPLLFCFALWGLPAAAAIPSVILFHLLAGLVLTFLLARQLGLARSWALGAAAFLALCPIYLFMGLQPMSDVPSLVWITGAVVLALQVRTSGSARRTIAPIPEVRPFSVTQLEHPPLPPRVDVPSPTLEPRTVSVSSAVAVPAASRPAHCGLALACGVVTAVAVLLRPANIIALPIVALALCSRPRALLFWILGGLPFAILEAVYNQQLYGHPFLTGYGSTGGLFSAEWIGPTLLHYLYWLPAILTPAVAAVLLLPFRPRIASSTRLLLAVWIGLFLAFYATYSCTHETWWYLRFLLPAIPPLIVGTLLVLRDFTSYPVVSRRPSRRLFTTIVALCVAGWLLCLDFRLHVLDSAQGNRVYADSSHWLEENAPADALVVCSYTSGALYYYSHRAFFQPASPAQAAQVLAAAAVTRRPVYAAFFKFDQQPLAWFTGGHWSEVHRSGDIILWRWVSA